MSIYAPITCIGGNGGRPFENYGLNGKVLEKIEVWVGPSQIRAIRVWMSGDEPVTYGKPKGTPKAFTFEPGERFTRLSLWGNGEGTRAGAIRFDTSTGRSFLYGMTEWGWQTEYRIDVGSGICVGVTGRSGFDIDMLGFVFLNPVAYAALTDVSYPTLTAETPSIVPESLDTFSDDNTGQQPRTYTFAGTRAEEVSETWSMTRGLEVYMEVTVQAGIPQVASVSGTFGWKVTATSTYSLTQKAVRTLSWSVTGTLQPGQRISLAAVTRRGRIFIPWSGTMVVTMASGETFSYAVSGEYRGVEYAGVEIMDTVQAAALRALPLRMPVAEHAGAQEHLAHA